MSDERPEDAEAVEVTETAPTAPETGGDDSAAGEIRRTLKVITTQLATIEDRLSSIDTWRKKTGW